MKTNWAKTVAAINREKYTIPEGWDTRDQVAQELQCAPDRVADLLKPGLQSGKIERQEFPVWDDARRMTVRVSCFRVANGNVKAAEPAAKPVVSTNQSEMDRVTRALQRNSKQTDYQIAKNNRSTVPVVAKVRRSLGL